MVLGAAWSAGPEPGVAGLAWRGQRHRWLVEGREVVVEVVQRGAVDPSGRITSWERWRDDGADGSWRGAPSWWLDQAAEVGTLPVGTVSAVHPTRGDVVPVEVSGASGRWSWVMDGVPSEVTHGEAGSRQRWGDLERRPVATEPTLEPVDPVALVWRPSRPFPGARQAWWSRWQVGEEERVVEAPLRLEVPAATLRQVEALVREVRQRVAFSVDLTPADPVAALSRRRGDCDQQAAVLVALARERGWSARPVAGVVYTESDRGPGLELHAWAEIELPGLGWVAVDPALDQALADATHLPLAVDGATHAAAAVLTSGARLELSQIR